MTAGIIQVFADEKQVLLFIGRHCGVVAE